MAKELLEELKFETDVAYDEKDAIGRRYRRQDALGTPFCITIDHDSLQDNSVTIRYRDTMKQERIKISEVKSILNKELNFKNWIN